MSIHTQVRVDAVTALKAKDAKKRETLSFLMSELNKIAKDEKLETLGDERAISVLRKSLKARKETLEAAAKASRDDMIQQTEYEIGLITGYLPIGLSEDDMKALVVKVIAETGATSIKHMGQVMAQISKEVPGSDKAAFSAIVKGLLAK